MSPLAQIIQSSTPSSGAHFRAQAYGRAGIQSFLRDVLALANASVKGPRHIVVGVDFDDGGRKRISPVDRDDFSGKPAYQAVANEYLEPPVRIHYKPVTVDGDYLGVFEIGDCQDRPYMMRIDYSETLRRGDAYRRVNESIVKMGRRELQSLFEKKFRDSVPAANIEVGFFGEIIHKSQNVVTSSLETLPSAIAGFKLKEMIEAKSGRDSSGTGLFSTVVDRLTHARVFGSDDPYEARTAEELRIEMRQIERQYRDHDDHFLFEEHASNLQLVVFNHSDEPVSDASLSLTLPNHGAFHVAERLPRLPRDDGFVERTPNEQADYPAVSFRDDSIHVTAKLGDVPGGEPVEVFTTPLRICVGSELKGRRIGIHYSLFAKNLREPAKGRLRLLF